MIREDGYGVERTLKPRTAHASDHPLSASPRAGPSSGAALAASLRVAQELAAAHRPAVIVMIFPDSGARYVSEGLFAPPGARSFTQW